ncbi:TPM domain-containing protein [Herbaspirillum seropedicae]|uniref:Glycine rich transmembrane protein n=1 Tax=Herbaspirillum seropedicae (strain SmR1) TaxID=757424 RepID=D8J265_HERSS|nr:TPM domain-containing protein [Herbaspirillum seropedicae]ADJ64848.1 glycine rich transmembrane protein [Herbaspirillum seropedicae SmR1]
MRKLLLSCWLLAWLALAGPARADDGLVPVPPLSGHVIDQVHLLQAQQRQALEGVLTEIEQRTGSQIGVLLMSSTAPEAIEQYSIRVADAWKLGRKGIDDGVILIVAKDNPKSLRRLRIEAGRGVQGSLTDAQSKRILEDVIAPHFRQNDFYGGLAAGVTAITTLLEQEKLPPSKRQASTAQPSDGGGWITLLVIGLFLVVFFSVLLKSRRGSRNNLNDNDWGRGRSTTAGVIIGSILDEAARQASSGRGWPRSGGGGGFGGSSGGGFSGGGGSFDGGGASGDW